MKFLALLTTLLFSSPSLAIPTKGMKEVLANRAAARSPHCKTAALEALCLTSNAQAYCDVTGFHNNFPTSCDKNCWC
ncbi:hypothetical protein QBC38DRAFT_480065, partial [Podospora fimiseda]